jgi:hypothetical protein
MSTTTTVRLDQALTLAQLGYPLLPICSAIDGQCGCGQDHSGRNIGKAPVGRLAINGVDDATTDEARILEWWADLPSAGIAIALAPACVVVIDPDSQDAQDEAARLGVSKRSTRQSRWDSYLHKRPDGCPNIRAIHRGQSRHIDVLASGYCVVFTTHAEGHEVTLSPVMSPDALPDCPRWAVDMLRAQTDPKASVDLPDLSDLPGVNISELRLPPSIRKLILEGADAEEHPSRSEALWKVERSMLAEGYDERTIAAAILRNPIGACVREKRNPKNWLAGDIRRAKEKPDKPYDGRLLVLSKDSDGQVREQDIPANIGMTSLADVESAFSRWLHIDDLRPVYAALGAVAANYMGFGDPVWLVIVGPSAGGKTEIVNAMSALPNAHAVATLTESALLSGTPKRDKDKTAKGGLLREIGDFGIIALKDLTSILSMNRDSRAAVLAALREIYDGSWTRAVGVDGGRVLSWSGKVGLIAGCTAAIDAHHAVMATMGERFLLCRLPEIDRQKQGHRALSNVGREIQMRHELSAVVRGFFETCDLSAARLSTIGDGDATRLVALADLVASARSGVERDGRTREIELILDTEAPARLVQSLGRLRAGLLAIGLPGDIAWATVVKVGLDSIPKLRRSAFDALGDDWRSTPEIADLAGYPTVTARRALEDLMVHGVAIRAPGESGKADRWRLSDEAQSLYAQATETVSEMSEGECSDHSSAA